jgi:hypothetical protein
MYENEIVGVERTSAGSLETLYFLPVLRSISNEIAIQQTLASPGKYYFTTEDGEKQHIYARCFLRTASDDTEENNLRALPITSLEPVSGAEAFEAYGSREGFEVTHIRIRTAGPEPWNSWVSHLCNDAFNLQIPTAEAENRIIHFGSRYFLTHEGIAYDLEIEQYLHTQPDESTVNNMDSIPDMIEYLRLRITNDD